MKFLETAFNKEIKEANTTITYLDTESYPIDKIKDWGSKESDGYETMSIKAFTKFVALESFSVSFSYNMSMERDIENMHGLDLESMMKSVLENESLFNREKRLNEIYNNLGNKSENEIIISSKWRKILLKIFPKMEFPTYIEDTNINGVKKLISSIILRANLIGVKSRRGPGDFIVCNGLIGSLIQDHPSFVFINNEIGGIKNPIGNRLIGTIGGRILVFVNPNMAFKDTSILIGRITKESQPGVYILENKELKKIDKLENNFSPNGEKKIRLVERLSFVTVGDCSSNFIRFTISLNKKPLWRKILFV